MRNKKFTSFFTVLMGILLITAITGCSRSADSPDKSTAGNETYTIGVILNHTQDVFMKNLESGFIAEAAKYPELEMKLVESGMDPAKQLSQVEQLISEKVDVIVLNPANQESSATAVEAAMDANIPIFTVNTMTTPAAQSLCLTYVGSDATESGRIQGRYVAQSILKGSGKVAYMNATMGHQAQIDRYNGTMEIFKDYPGIEIVLEGSADWRTDKAVTLTENWLQSDREIDVIVCQGADMALGAVLALKDAGKNAEIQVSGIDISGETAKELLAGNIANLVFQDAKGQGEAAVRAALTIAKGGTVDLITDIPYELVTKDNCSDYDGRY
jgi:inositol transport system substrate-binding protein